MRFVADLSKGILGQADSFDLWNSIVSQIPDSVLLKKNVKILNISCGHGTEADMIVKRMKSLGRSSNDIKEAIWLLDKYHVFTNRAKRKGYTNVLTVDFLEWKTDMKFDVIVGNPPYQGDQAHGLKIWPTFTVKALELLKDNGHIGWVIPSGWLESNNAQMKKVRTLLTTECNLLTVNRNANDHFNVGQDILSFNAEKSSYNGQTTYIEGNDSLVIDLRQGMVKSEDDLIIDSILDKVVNSPDDRLDLLDEYLPSSEVSKNKTTEYKHPIIYSTANQGFTKVRLKNAGQLKLALNLSSSFYNSKAADKNMPITTDAIGSLMCYLPVSSVAEGEAIRNYLCTKLIRFVAHFYKRKNTGFNHAVRQRKLPKLSLINPKTKKAWTDNDIYSYFNLTPDEIDYVECSIK